MRETELPRYAVIVIVLALAMARAYANPIDVALGIYYTVFINALLITIVDATFRGEWGFGMGLLVGAWLGVVANGFNPVQALTAPLTWLLGTQVILP